MAFTNLNGDEYIKETTEKITIKITQVCVDLGYRGHKIKKRENLPKVLMVNRYRKNVKMSERFWMRRRSAIEPIIGHLKNDHHLGINRLKGTEGDKININLAAAGFNLKKLLKSIKNIMRLFCPDFYQTIFVEIYKIFFSKHHKKFHPTQKYYKFDRKHAIFSVD